MKAKTYYTPGSNNRGVALLLAVTVISLLVAVTVKFSKDMRQELIGSANLLASSRLGTMVKSGYNISTVVLQRDGDENTFDSSHDNWALLANSDLSQLYGQGKLSIQVSDLGGLLPFNSFVDEKTGKSDGVIAKNSQNFFRTLLKSGNYGELADEEIELIINAVIDWIDPDDNSSATFDETESSYYQRLDPPYSCKNGPLEFIEELLLIRGITTDLYYGNVQYPGLKDLVTVMGKGQININTAPASVLLTLDTQINSDLVEELLAYRNDEENKDSLEQKTWYKAVWPDINLPADSVSTSSEYFRISVTARHNEMEKTLRAVVHRPAGKQVTMISRKVE